MTEPNSSNLLESLFAGDGEMCALMRSHDWSQTPLGSVEQWPQSLRTTVSILLNSRYPMFTWWGSEYANLYNDAYRPMLGANKHPQFLGQSAKDCWADIWDVVGALADSVITTGKSTWSENLQLLMDRYGYIEETYFTFSYSPVRDESGGIGGVFCAVTETTEQILAERRLLTLRELASQTAEAKTAEAACRIAVETLSQNLADIPFALLYLLEADGKQAQLVGTTGIDAGTSASPQQVDLTQETDPWLIARVNRTGQAERVDNLEKCFGKLPGGVWDISPVEALVMPIAQSGKPDLAGFLVLAISPRREFDDNYRGFFDLVANNVTTAIANANAYEAERKRAEALAEIDRAKTIFFSNVSHEFRTPLTLMLAPVEDALADTEEALSPAQRDRITIVQHNSLRLLKLVNTLLDFSRIEAGRIQAVYEPTDLATLTAELASTFRSLIERAGMSLVVKCPPLPAEIYVDREMWEKIVLNLLSNAFKFTFTGTITVRLQGFENSVELAVEDTGIGIPPDEIPRLFERFYRVRGVEGRSFEGSGIGLSLVQELVKLHGGSVHVTSELGKGSCFTVSIPTGFAHLPPERMGASRTLASTAMGATPYVEEAWRWLPEESGRVGERESGRAGERESGRAGEWESGRVGEWESGRAGEWESGRAGEWESGRVGERESGRVGERETGRRGELPITHHQSPTTPSLSSAHILVVDDNADMRDYAKRLLGQRYDVEAVEDGMAALTTMSQRIPDLVLTDVMMPRLDGFGLLRELRADPKTREIPIILLSARAGEESRIEGLEAGADDYLIKPFSSRELLARVEANLKLAQIRREAAAREQALRLAAEKAQQEAEATAEQLTHILASMTDAFMTLDKDWRIIYQNAEAERINNATPRSEILGKTHWEVWPASAGSILESQYRYAMAEQVPVHFEYYYYVPPDYDVWVEIHAYPSTEGLGIFYHDITERKRIEAQRQQAEEELRQAKEQLEIRVAERTAELRQINANLQQSESTLRSFFDSAAMPMGIVELHENDVLHISDNWAAAQFFGTTPEAMQHQFASVLGATQETIQRWSGYYRQAEQTQKPVWFEYLHDTAEGQRWLSGSVCPIAVSPSGHPRFSYIVEDITERKRSEETLARREEQLRLTLEFTHIGTWDWDLQTNEVIWNDNHFRLLGLEPEPSDALYQRWRNAIHPEDVERVEQRVFSALNQHTDFEAEYRVVYPDGTIHWLIGKGRGIYNDGNGPIRMLGVIIDVSEQQAALRDRKQAQERLEASLQEKEVLLKEIHHRVKNNLGIITSLLRMQSRRTQDSQANIILRDSQNRIASIALVHEKLYRSEDLANINFTQYIRDLTVYLFESYNVSSNQIKLSIQVDNVGLDVDTAIPCGLIINELVANALKYAFPGDREGEIQVRFYQANEYPSERLHLNTFTLIVRDNGIGLPNDFDIKKAKTLGLTLVQGLVKQIDGTIEINSQPGTEFNITFKKSNT